ncbi:MAG: hypothetical protein TU36_003745 [Vulcanisaeta sp. AZ3]|jgi:hypothetical protein|nr:MAG: hypothetical protein TU36_02375 [Vulcanisaeta sp. AZ3]
MDLIERISELRMLINRLENKYPELSELSSLIDDIIIKCVSLSDILLNIYSITDSATRSLIFENNSLPTNLNSALIRRYLSVIRASDDLNEVLIKVPQEERHILIDAIKILKKRGMLDLDIDYDKDGLKIKIISRVEDNGTT